MADKLRLICDSTDLKDGGIGVRFETPFAGENNQAFAVRFEGKVHGYLNRCAHVPIELDWMEGEFFDNTGLYFICSTHGATYAAETGLCVSGPCVGKSLRKLSMEERDGKVYLME